MVDVESICVIHKKGPQIYKYIFCECFIPIQYFFNHFLYAFQIQMLQYLSRFLKIYNTKALINCFNFKGKFSNISDINCE